MLIGVDKIKSDVEMMHSATTPVDHAQSDEQVLINADAKERDDKGPWTLWSQSSNLVKSAALETTQAENDRMSDILVKYGHNNYNWSPLNMALEKGDYESALFLIEHGANLKEATSIYHHAYWPLDRVFIEPFKLHKEKLQDNRGVKKHHPNAIDYRTTIIPVEDQEIVRKLLFAMINRGAHDSWEGRTCRNISRILSILVEHKWYDIFETALKTMRSQSHIDWKSMYTDFIRDGNELGIQILDKSLTKHTLDNYCPKIDERLIAAISANNFTMVKYFVDLGANVNCGNGPIKPLTIAAKMGNKEIIDLLISRGAKLG